MEILDTEPPGNTNKNLSKSVSLNGSSIPLLHYIPKTRKNHFFYKNGLSKLIPRLTVKVHSNIEDCFNLWEKFSPNKSLFDLWDFRFAWYQGYGYKPYFYTVYERQKPLGVLPLWYNEFRKKYQWFGSDWMEDNTFFVEDEKFIDVLFQIAPSPIHLNAIDMNGDDWNERSFHSLLKKDDPKNLKNIENVSSMDDLLYTLNKKDRYNLKSDYFRIMRMNPKVKITRKKSLPKMNKMIKMNIERFSKDPTDESDLVDPERRKTYQQMVKNAGVYDVKFVEVTIQNHLAAIDFIITYKDTYYTMKGSNDLNRFNGIGNFMVYTEFDDAIKEGYDLVDCLQMDNGWKHRFFTQKELYIVEK